MSINIVFSSEKGGVGKTTSAVNLSMSLASAGFQVLLIDMDPQSSVRFAFGLNTPVRFGTQDLLNAPGVPLEKTILPTPGVGLDYIFANFKDLPEEQKTIQSISPTTLKDRLNQAPHYDFIVLDAPASLNMLAINAISAAHLVILPLQCEPLAIRSLKRYLLGFHHIQRSYNPSLRIAGILLTMYDKDMAIHRRLCRQVYGSLGDSVLQTIIPRSRELVEATALGQSVLTYDIHSIGAIAYLRFSKELLEKFGPSPSPAARFG